MGLAALWRLVAVATGVTELNDEEEDVLASTLRALGEEGLDSGVSLDSFWLLSSLVQPTASSVRFSCDVSINCFMELETVSNPSLMDDGDPNWR